MQVKNTLFSARLRCSLAWKSGTRQNFYETYTSKTRGTGLLCGETCTFLTNCFWLICLCDRQTDGRAIAHLARSAQMLMSRANNSQ